ncbi:hypothetical protein ACRSLK_06250 [Halopseudomonas pachastrellae]
MHCLRTLLHLTLMLLCLLGTDRLLAVDSPAASAATQHEPRP